MPCQVRRIGVVEHRILTYGKGTCSVSKLRGKKRRSAKGSARRVRIGVPDGSLTALAGLAAVDELTGRLVTELDRGIGPIKQRDRGLSVGQLLMGMAAAQLVGRDCLAGLDRSPPLAKAIAPAKASRGRWSPRDASSKSGRTRCARTTQPRR